MKRFPEYLDETPRPVRSESRTVAGFHCLVTQQGAHVNADTVITVWVVQHAAQTITSNATTVHRGMAQTEWSDAWTKAEQCATAVRSVIRQELHENADIIATWRQRAEEAEEVVTGVVEDRNAYANTVKWITEVNDRYREALRRIVHGVSGVDPHYIALDALDGKG